MTIQYTYNDTEFRTLFPAFSDPTKFPTVLLQQNWNLASTIVSDTDYGFVAQQGGDTMMNYMTAHITQLGVLIASGQAPMITLSATIDRISVSNMPPPIKSYFSYWLATTPYGQFLLALLDVASVGGLYTPGGLGRSGMGNGGFGGGWGYGNF